MSDFPSHPTSAPSAICPECGGECVPVAVYVGPGTTLMVQRPDALFTGVSGVRAQACTQCGLMRFYVATPARLDPVR